MMQVGPSVCRSVDLINPACRFNWSGPIGNAIGPVGLGIGCRSGAFGPRIIGHSRERQGSGQKRQDTARVSMKDDQL